MVCEVVGLISTPFTLKAIPTWYIIVHKPFFSPPNWLFGPVWTILYLLMGVAAFLIWKKGLKNKKARKAFRYFSLQLFFNLLWSVLFFGFHAPLLGLIDIIVLLIFIVLTMNAFKAISKPSFYLLIPYIIWVSFATLLNLAIVVLNR